MTGKLNVCSTILASSPLNRNKKQSKFKRDWNQFEQLQAYFLFFSFFTSVIVKNPILGEHASHFLDSPSFKKID